MGTYRVTRKLGAGSLFESYVGAQRQPQGGERAVWLRRLVPPWATDSHFSKRFGLLAEHWRNMPADEVAPLVEWGVGGDSNWVCQSVVDGESIRTLLGALAAARQRPQINEVVAVGIRAAGAIAAVHETSLGLFHGDVCATTLHLTSRGEVMLTDFGIATAAGVSPQAGPARAEAHTVAPEQQSGKNSPATDLYRLGLVMYEMWTGRTHVDPTWHGVPEKLATALAWMLAPDPTQRPQARDIENAMHLAAEQAGWSVTTNDLVRFLARVLPNRAPHDVLPAQGGTELLVQAAAPAPLARTASPPVAKAADVPSGSPLGKIATRKLSAETLAHENHRAALQAASRSNLAVWKDTKVGEALVAKQKLSTLQLKTAMQQAESLQTRVSDAIINLKYVDEDAVVAVEGELTKTPVVTGARLLEMKPSAEVLERLKSSDAESLNVVPIGVKPNDQLVVAMRDPLNVDTVDAVQKLSRAASIFAVRAGPEALTRAIASYYLGVDLEDPSSWLENTAKHSVEAAPNAFQGAVSGIFESSGSGMMELETRGPLAPQPQTPGLPAPPSEAPVAPALIQSATATLNESQVALLEVALLMAGDKGKQVQQLVALAASMAKKLSATDADIGRVRYAMAAIGLANASVGKPAWELVRSENVALIAAGGWRGVQELVTRGLDLAKTSTHQGVMAIQAALIVANVAGHAKPVGEPLARAVQALRSRRFPQPLIDAFGRATP